MDFEFGCLASLSLFLLRMKGDEGARRAALGGRRFGRGLD